MAQDESDVTETTPAGDVRVERAIRRKEGGVTVEYTVRGPSGESAEFRIREPLDESVPLTEAGFHPEQEPQAWSIEDDAVTFEDEIPADGSFETVFGAVADEPFFSGEPLVERTDKKRNTESGGFLSGVKRRLFGGSKPETENEPGDVTPIPESEAGASGSASNGGEPDGVTILADAERDLDATGPPEDGGDAVAEGDAIEEAEESADKAEESTDEAAAESDVEPDETADEGTADTPNEDDDMDTDTGHDDRTRDSETEPTDDAVVEEAESSDDASEAAGDVSVETLVAALETDDELRAAFREALGVTETADDGSSKSMDVRLRHVQSRVDDLAAYTHTLEDAIDQHGPPAEVLGDLKSETESLREEVTELREEQAVTRERVDELAETTDSLRTELTEAGERRDARLDGVESDVDGVATDLRATRDELEAELDAMREELEALQKMRESLTAAFGGTGAMGGLGEEETEEQDGTLEPNEERRE